MGEDGLPASQLPRAFSRDTLLANACLTPQILNILGLVTSSYNMLLVGMFIDKHSGVALHHHNCHQSVTHTRCLSTVSPDSPLTHQGPAQGCLLFRSTLFFLQSELSLILHSPLLITLLWHLFRFSLCIHECHVSPQVFVFSSVPLDCEHLVSRNMSGSFL